MSLEQLPSTLPLAWLIDEHFGKAYPIGDHASIGRGGENKVILRDNTVSRVHADIERNGERYTLFSHGASGTRVNGVPVADTRELQEGDLIEIAYAELRFTRRTPTAEMLVVARDSLTPLDGAEMPTGVALRAARPLSWLKRWWRRLIGWLTRRRNTD